MDSTQQLIAVIALLIIGLLLTTSCGPQERHVNTEQPSGKIEDYPQLESRLFELATAQEPAKYAKEHDIDYDGGLVRVVIETQDPTWAEDIAWAVEVLGGHLEASYQELIQAQVPVGVLLMLAEHPRVRMISTPVEAHPDEE
ncbi:MAG: hypothetical protein A2Z21_03625 [Candidatus Fraserbacteria bacterium RBG_16_55_9]|uniref:Uncharacterized protein n=1 Tax=Fraserbacteria sp. (strain RBG_16_55_9) TaxID=1817864 RepID=A0A1F5UZN3_FRAXR|nr:MAG: hypothetical protein A2Z21_03625 [Candidatus Fraserbacteria bacterium RBG_16_55_9]